MTIHIIILGFIFLVMYVIAENNRKINESGVDEVTRRDAITDLVRKRNTNMAVRAKLKNVYKTYQDTTVDPYNLIIYDDRLAYVNEITTVETFSIPLENITNIQCDTFERLTVTRFLMVGLLSFAIPKKTYCIAINYRTPNGTEETALFTPDKNMKYDYFVNNVLIARNRLTY